MRTCQIRERIARYISLSVSLLLVHSVCVPVAFSRENLTFRTARPLFKLQQDHPPSPRPSPRPNPGGPGPGGSFSGPPPAAIHTAPASNLPNLAEARRALSPAPSGQAGPTKPIELNLPCADCDPQSGGGGSGYYPSGDPNFSTARKQLRNETGEENVDLGSRNFNWALPLVSLPGRAGLDLNLALFYNSLVWTKDGSFIKYNADLGSPAPGFRLGLPKLQQRFLNSQTGGFSYLMITPSGGRVELRQVGTNLYESADSSYTQLDDSTLPSSVLVRTADGSQLTFIPVTVNNEYRCTQIKDRNGNFISASYNTINGHITSITDTLGRVIEFYEESNNLAAVRQMWAGGWHNWATFQYDQVYVAPAFGGVSVNGPNGNYVPVLTRVTLHDGAYFTFSYNNFGQVYSINRYAPDNHLLAYTAYGLNTNAGQTDCPRVDNRGDWAQNWNGDTDGIPAPAEQAATFYAVAGDDSWTQVTTPDQTTYKEFFYTSGWQKGLTYRTEVWANSSLQKFTTTDWTQDDTGLTYQKNPRATETNIYDNTVTPQLRRRTTISYASFTLPTGVSCSLPSDVTEYKANATDQLRRSHTDYVTDANYINSSRRLIGLPSFRFLYDENNALASKVEYQYDWGSEHLQDASVNANTHDNQNFGIGFLTGRGNLTFMRRYDVTDPTNVSKAVEHKWGYNIAGSMTFDRDHLFHQANISYADSFSDNINRNTLAYPTSVTDEDGFQSLTKFNFDFGGVTLRQIPSPNSGQTAPSESFTYDSIGRLQRITNDVNLTYTRFSYPASGDYLTRFSTIQDGLGEAAVTEAFDGIGRVCSVGADLPNSSGGYVGKFMIYDNMGRLIKESHPTEINANWVPVGDDAAAGWLVTEQTYDWKGRPRITTNSDGTTRENIYSGCGCAGGEVVTTRDEAARRKRATMDVVGRLYKLEELDWNQSVYSTTLYSYNARDQITNIDHAGQARTFEYDGHGRLWHKTTPEQGTMTYTYFQDDMVQTVTDARGATTTFAYNARHLPTNITYGVPVGVAATANVSFAYDPAGNRTSMTDGLGSVSYSYDQLSRLASEVRSFTGLGSFALSYQYNLAGQLTKITNPWNVEVSYNRDKIGRVTSVSGANYIGLSSYVNSISYRAFGASKQINYANGRVLSLQYNNRLFLSRWDLPNPGGGSDFSNALGYTYDYNRYGENNSGRPDFADSLYDSTLDRSWDYDHVGRMIGAYTGINANNIWTTPDGPYAQSHGYDVWGNRTHREGWGGIYGGYVNDNPTFTNNKQNGYSYDAAGNFIFDGSFTYDATGQHVSYSAGGLTQSYDGDRLRVKKTESGVSTYYLRSTVLGGEVVAEIGDQGGTPTNVALGKPATQSSDPGWGGPPSKAVDGNTNGNYSGDSVTHTNNDAQAWWQVDLGTLQSVQSVKIWNRTDCCGDRLTNFNVILLDASQAVVSSVNVPGQAGSPTTVPISGAARYVKVQLVGTNYLSLAEVEVMGTTPGSVWTRGYVYLGGQLIALQQSSSVTWVHQEPFGKGQRITDASGNIISAVEVDPFGGEVNRGFNQGWQPKKFTSYIRDGGDSANESMHRRYNQYISTFYQPDPYDGSYDFSDPQSFNRYSYVQGDPVNLVDPMGLDVWEGVWIGPPPASVTIPISFGDPVSTDGLGLFGGGHPILEEAIVDGGGGGGGPQDPLPTPKPAPAPTPAIPCAGKKASDLDYSTPSYRGTDKNGQAIYENGIDHITRRHILVDSGEYFLTPSRLPISRQESSKYVFQDNVTTLKDAQKLIIAFNSYLFDTGKKEFQAGSNSNIRITGFAPITPKFGGGVFFGTGFDRKRGFGLPTNAGTLIVDSSCTLVVTSFPGLP